MSFRDIAIHQINNGKHSQVKAALEYLRKMKFWFFTFLGFLLFSSPVSGQFSADFADGSLDAWQGDKANFVVNASQQLQLSAPSGSTSSWLYTPVTYTDSMVWDIYFKLDFAPSTSNQLKIYLGASSSDLATASGYFLEIGATGDQDALELKYLHNGTSELVAASAPALVGTEPVELTLRIIRKGDGMWQCYNMGGSIPELLFSASHDLLPLPALSLFGFSCKYSDTRRDKFYFDDISIQPLLPDVTAPTWVSISVLDEHSVELVFDEPLDQAAVVMANNYTLTPGNTHPDLIELNQPKVKLTWNTSFQSQLQYTLAIQALKDAAGNVIVNDQKTFTYIRIDKALPYDLLITEIMADPTPVLGMPDAEYIELFNSSSAGVFNLSDYTLQVGTTAKALPNQLIQPGEYIILCDETKAPLFSGAGRIVPITSFPSLTNSGATIMLKDPDGVILHDVSYTTAWYGDPGKADGGWSLEMINPLHQCSDIANWSAPVNLTGGTPGSVNTQWTITPDVSGPELVSLFTAGDDQIILRFDERLDALLMENPALYSIQPALALSQAVLNDANSIQLTLAAPIQAGVVYQLLPFITYDCLGNEGLTNDTITFGLTAAAEPGDVLINEIMFNPASGGARFLEIYNASQKFIDLSSLTIGRIRPGQQDLYPTGINEVLAPGQLCVFSPEPADILSRYQVPQPSRLFDAALPSWDDMSDNVSILSGGIVIDSLTYSSDWHLPVIADQNGVSLERVSAISPSTIPSNWHSASSVSGYGTPTGVNSQNINLTGETKPPFTVVNPQFSPNEDGYKDYLALNFLLESGEEIGSVWIYDLEGREIISLISNESLGTSAIVQWDGRNEEQVLADMGIYVIFVQLWDAAGNVREYQETCALVKR